MRDIYNEDHSPDSPEQKQDFFQCLMGCNPNQNVFKFANLLPSRSVKFSVVTVIIYFKFCLVDFHFAFFYSLSDTLFSPLSISHLIFLILLFFVVSGQLNSPFKILVINLK